VHPERGLLYDSENTGLAKSLQFQAVVDEVACDPSLGSTVRSVMISHFREDWGRLVEAGLTLSSAEGLAFRRALPHEGLDGQRYKSFGEKAIANFLFEHDIPYGYERNHWWDGLN